MIEFLTQFSVLPYVICVVIATYITIKYFKPEASKKQKLGYVVMWGLFLGIVWWFLVKPDLQLMIVSFFACAGFYDLIIKWILTQFNAGYKDQE